MRAWPGVALAVVIVTAALGFTLHGHEISTATFRTGNLLVDLNSTMGAVGDSSDVGVGIMNVNGPTRQTVTIPGGAYSYGELNLSTIGGTVPDFPHDLFVSVIRNTATADTTAHSSHSGGFAIETNGVHNVGANPATFTAIELDATCAGAACVSAGDTMEALHVFHGDITTDAGNITLNGTSSNIFQTGASGFIATLGTLYPEGGGTNAIDISGAPTNEIRMRQGASLIDVQNASPSSLTFYNSSDGVFRLQLATGSTPTTMAIFDPQAPTSVSHGSLGTGSSNLVGNITGVGSFTSTVLTFSNSGFPNHAWCFATPNGHTVTAQFIEVTLSKTAPTFSCFTTTTGAAANCDDFSYQCIGQ